MDLTIKGFKNKEEIIEFMNWYSGQGEQDFCVWLECRIDEDIDVRDFIPCINIDKINNIMFLKE